MHLLNRFIKKRGEYRLFETLATSSKMGKTVLNPAPGKVPRRTINR
jgi:hypothetical protein